MTSRLSTLYCLVNIAKLSTNKAVDGKLSCTILILLNKLFVKGSFRGQCFLKTHKVKKTLKIRKAWRNFFCQTCLLHSEWLEGNALQRVVMVITQVDTEEVIERWQFDIHCENSGQATEGDDKKPAKYVSGIIDFTVMSFSLKYA